MNEINETDGCSRGLPSAFSLEPVALLQSIFDRSLFVVPQCLRLRGDDSPLGLKIDAVLELLVVIYICGGGGQVITNKYSIRLQMRHLHELLAPAAHNNWFPNTPEHAGTRGRVLLVRARFPSPLEYLDGKSL